MIKSWILRWGEIILGYAVGSAVLTEILRRGTQEGPRQRRECYDNRGSNQSNVARSQGMPAAYSK